MVLPWIAMASSSGMTIPISLVCFCNSLSPLPAEYRLFLGVAGLGLMSNGAHNVGLTTLLINRVFHSFAVNGKAFVFLSMRCMPLLQGQIELLRVHPDKHITKDGFTGYLKAALHVTTTKTLPPFGAKRLGPIPDGLI